MSSRFAVRALAMATALVGALLLPSGLVAGTLIDNINGIAADRTGTVTRFTGLVVDNQGRVEEVLRQGAQPVRRPDYRVDGKGRTVIPGLVDAHAHVMALGFAQLTLDLSGTRSLAQAQAAIAAYAAANPERPWIIGRGWNQETWGLGRFPTAAELDAAVSDRPVWLERADGHAGWANSAALKLAGITERTNDPPAGRIERLPGVRRPAGVLIDTAMPLVSARVPPPRPQDRDAALLAAQDLLLSRGITAVTDMGTSIEDWMAFRRAGDGGRLRIRIMTYADGVPTMLLIGGTRPTPWLYEDRLRLNGLKLFLDGALGSRGAWLKQPYADDPRNKGLPRLNPTQLRNLMSRAAMDNFQIAVHAIGDAANAEVVGAIEELAADYQGDRRWRIEHAQVIDPADIARFGRFGIVASMQPVHQPSDRLMAEARLGPGRLAGAYAWRSLLTAGAALAFGSDAPVEAPDGLATIAAAISRQDDQGLPAQGWQPQERLDFGHALAASTAGAAWAGFADGRFGTLAVGERADFVMLDRDPAGLDAASLRRIAILQTWVAGQPVFERPVSSAAPQPLAPGPAGP